MRVWTVQEYAADWKNENNKDDVKKILKLLQGAFGTIISTFDNPPPALTPGTNVTVKQGRTGFMTAPLTGTGFYDFSVSPSASYAAQIHHLTAAVDGTGISNVRAQFNSVTGQVTLTFDVANNAPLVAHTLTLTSPDGQTTTGTITVVANTPPVLAGIEGPPALQYTENDPPVAVTSTLTLTDLDNQTGFTAQARATIQITAGFQAATPGQPGQ